MEIPESEQTSISRRSQGLEGVRFGDHRISSLLFADDVVLLAPSSLDLQHALGCFAAECEAAGLRVSTSKPEAMVLDRKKVSCTLQVGGEFLPQVEEFKEEGSCLRVREGWMQLVLRQRTELLGALCCGGSAEPLDSVLDFLLSWDVLIWEDYHNVQGLNKPLCSKTRDLLDLVYTKGEESCSLLLAAFDQVLPEAQKAGLCFGKAHSKPRDIKKTPTSASEALLIDRPALVKKIRDHLDGVLDALMQAGCFTSQDCDEVLLPVYTSSQKGTLMKGVRKVITSRPHAVSPSMKHYLRKEVLVKGFSPVGIDQFCYKELLGCGEGSPQTVTDVYLMVLKHFLQKQVPQQCRTLGQIWLHEHIEMVRRLGQLALEGLETSCYLFTESDLQKCSITKQDIDLGFLIQCKDFSDHTDFKHYEFLHITMQCFFAALYIVLDKSGNCSVILNLFQSHSKQPGVFNHTNCFVHCMKHVADDCSVAETPNLQITSEFVAGLLSQRCRSLLVQSCPATLLERKSKQVMKCLSKGLQKHFRSIPPPVKGEKKSMHAMPSFVWLIKCIYEMQESEIAKDAVAKLEVEHFKLIYCNIGPVECTALAYVLSLRNNNISDEGVRKLVEKGVHWECFKKLALFNNNLTDDCTKDFAQLLQTKNNFLALRLGNNNITSQGAEQLAEGLRCNTSLKYLGLWGNKIGDKGAEALADALKESTTLIWLSSSGVSSRFSGFLLQSKDTHCRLIGIFKLCIKPLLSLFFDWVTRKMTFEGHYLGFSFLENNVVMCLCASVWKFIRSLADNRVGNPGARALAELVKRSTTLEGLWLNQNHISRDGVERLIEALKVNATIREVWLRGNNLSVEEVKELSEQESRLIF
ncbi:hypothetical protein QTP86_009418 [Hemibagrus guttatus]|nr:hypothetical protein QTP86_009418 [Hemibagrus guttatus]